MDFVNYVQKEMIEKDGYCSKVHKPSVNYSKRTLLLDSGAANIINRILKKIDYSSQKNQFMQELEKCMFEYYDYANRFKFDIVIGFDLGGKYTFKGDERVDEKIKKGNSDISASAVEINYYLLKKTLEYMQKHRGYYPKIYATVHGNSPTGFKKSIMEIKELEKEYACAFDGYAIGGVASYKNKFDLDEWFISGDEIKSIIKRTGGCFKPSNEFKNAVVATFATTIVKKYSEGKPIHVLGAGGKMNIVPLYLAGASSFDCQTPGRRAYDGSGESAEFVFDENYCGSESFSKYLIGKLKSDCKVINGELDFEYNNINEVADDVILCDCPACGSIESVKAIKELYSKYNVEKEDYYLSRQLMNCHGIWQHVKLCETICGCENIDDVEKKLSSRFPSMLEWKIIMNELYPKFVKFTN